MHNHSMAQDIRQSALYREAEAVHQTLRRPAAGVISDATEVSAHGTKAVFAGTLVDALIGTPPTRVCLTDLITGDTRVLTFGPNVDRLPKFSPDGQIVAFLSDRHEAGNFQLCLLDPLSGVVRSTPRVEGWVEYLHWSPNGKRILLGVAGHGADISGGQGAVTSKSVAQDLPSWAPAVETGNEDYRWRTAWVYELEVNRVRRVSSTGNNVWESVWCGNDAFAAVLSPGPGEGLWYAARLHIVETETGNSREVYVPQDQLGWPGASPSGKQLAVVEAICSDRWIVAGDLRLIETRSGTVRRVDTRGVNISFTEWRSDQHLLLAGHRGFETVTGLYDAASDTFTELWSSRDVTTGGRYVTVSGINESGDCVLVGESFVRAPEIAVIRSGRYQVVKSFDQGYGELVTSIEAVEQVRWDAPDGLEIQGWLLRPKGKAPHPLIMYIHGGPVWHWRPVWLGRGGVFLLMLIKRGYTVFLPNPRGSGGRGQDFTRHVLGEMGGADTYDYLSGVDHLVAAEIADPARLGVTGVSYGGFMTSWLITQDSRFAAAVAVAPISNQVTEHLISNIPHFVSLFLADTYSNPGGKYFQRSPIMYAHKVRTPTLNICGALDRCTPPEEAVQFHNALMENGVRSVLLTYPEEGHGIRRLPAAIDYAARVVAWFEEHMPADHQVS
jgi:dipeptidyl aminopeptidase/acylaminoacyl peptidase